MKICSRCKVSKNEDSFHVNSRKASGLRSDCRDCRNQYRRGFRQKNKGQFLAYESTAEFKAKSFDKTLKRKYGITTQQFEQMILKQDGLCKLCGKAERHKTKKKLSVDHCHVTGRVRGLLCHRCNVVLGLINEDVAVLTKAIEYLAKE